MKDISIYLGESLNEINEVAWVGPTLRYVGTVLLSTVIPYLISLGIRIATLKIDNWVNQLIKKYPNHKDAILLIAQVLKEDLDKCKKSKELINNSEHQKPSSYYKLSEYEDEILNCIQSEEDRGKVKELFNLIDSDDFKEDIDECLNGNEANIFEGLFDKQNTLKIPTNKTQLISSILYYMLFDEKSKNMTMKDFKEAYDKTVNYHTSNNYDIQTDLSELYKMITGDLPNISQNPIPKNSYIDTAAQMRQITYDKIAKREGLLY